MGEVFILGGGLLHCSSFSFSSITTRMQDMICHYIRHKILHIVFCCLFFLIVFEVIKMNPLSGDFLNMGLCLRLPYR